MEQQKSSSEPAASKPSSKDANYDPTNRDFQRTEEGTDNISSSEKEHKGHLSKKKANLNHPSL